MRFDELSKEKLEFFEFKKRMRQFIWMRDDYTCIYCGFNMKSLYEQYREREIPRRDVKLTVDHVVPLKSNGDWMPHNLVTACQSCNLKKGELPLNDSYEIIFPIPNRSQKIISRLLEMLVVWGEWAEKRRTRNSPYFRPYIRQRIQ